MTAVTANRPLGPLARRIARAKGLDVPEPTLRGGAVRQALRPVEPFKPAWLDRLTDRDESGRLVAP